MITALAVMTVFDESDILCWTLRHLHEQGFKVRVVDNWSTDGSSEIAQSFPLVGYEKFPADGPSRYYSWKPLLQRIEQIARESDATWIMSNDADEIRRSPVPGERMIDALARVDAKGYTAIDFDVYHFMPVDDGYRGDPERYFRYYTQDHVDNRRCTHVKAWRRTTAGPLRLAETGGHWGPSKFVRIYPHKFILKHYPIRTSAQAERKIVHERLERYDPEERARGWHVQYNDWDQTKWLRDPKTLKEWHA